MNTMMDFIDAYLKNQALKVSQKDPLVEEAIRIVDAQKKKLKSLSVLSNSNELIQWYNTTITLFSGVIIKEYYISIKSPQYMTYPGRAYLTSNVLILEDIIATIRRFPNSCLVKKDENFSSPEAISSNYISREVYENTRGFLEKLFDQINLTYIATCYDACSLCMRRSIEVCLILLYESKKLESSIKSNNAYFTLKKLINYTESNNTLNLSPSSFKTMKIIAELGNNSAHSIYYCCGENDLVEIRIKYKALIEELLYKSNIKK